MEFVPMFSEHCLTSMCYLNLTYIMFREFVLLLLYTSPDPIIYARFGVKLFQCIVLVIICI